MDSNLIKPIHSDAFDGIFWPNNTNEHMGLHQLTETFNGILPISTIPDRSEYISGSEIKDEPFEIEQKDVIVYNGEIPIFDNYVEEHLIPKGEDIEIVTNNPDDNAYHSGNNDDQNEYNCDASNDASYTNNINADLLESYSNLSDTTFRTRTDSSSIADYESHSSDYDDYDDYNYNESKCSDIPKKASNVDPVKSDLYFETGPLNSDEFLLDNDFKLSLINDFNFYDGRKVRTISTNTVTSDVFDLVPTDGSTFDLADFIIKDDNVENTTNLLTKPNVGNKSIKASSWHDVMIESDSDETVDIETIENAVTDNFEDVPFIDNVKTDPSWSPKDVKHENVKTRDNSLRKKAIADTQSMKKKLDILPKKCVRDEKNTITNIAPKDIQITNEVAQEITPECSSIQQVNGKLSEKRKLNIEEYKRRRGVGCNGVASACATKITKKDVCAQYSKEDIVKAKVPPPLKRHSEAVVSIVRSLKEEQESNTNYRAIDPISEARRKVMRMQELKRAQQLKIIDSTVSSKVPRVTKVLPLKDIIKDSKYCAAIEKEIPKADINSSINQDFEEIIIVSVSCNTDISLPPLNFIQNPCTNVIAVQRTNKVSRSLLKSSVLLQKVQASENFALSSNSLIASIQNTVVMKTMPSTQHKSHNSNDGSKNSKLNEENCTNQSLHPHGENKIIMHLRRDRIKKITKTMATQTEFLPEFPIFPLTVRRVQYRKCTMSSSSSSISSESDMEEETRSNCDRTHHTRLPDNIPTTSTALHFTTYTNSVSGGYSSRSSRRHRSSISSSYSESERISSQRRQRRSSYKNRSQKRTRSSSTSSTSSSHSDYSSRENRTRSRSPFHNSNNKSRWNRQRSQNNNDKNFTDRNVPQPAVEERRIVYVGRIEEHTTKEMLKRKFQTYGCISQITTHIKETGMRYGFVTFVRSQDAFAAIDSSSRDPQINMYDVSFGGRRAFCRASYADLDNAGINTYHSFVFPKALPTPTKEEDSFEALLLKVKAKLNANKSVIITTPSTTSNIDDTQSNNENCYKKIDKA